jgi:hypothetical protein
MKELGAQEEGEQRSVVTSITGDWGPESDNNMAEVPAMEPILFKLTLRTVEAQLAARRLESAVLAERFENANFTNEQVWAITRRLECVMMEGHTLQMRLKQMRATALTLMN